MKKSVLLVFFIAFWVAGLCWQWGFAANSIASYACQNLEKAYGAGRLDQAYEQEVRLIAQEMGIDKPIRIQQMNYTCLQKFGYHNAIVQFPVLWGIFPVANQPYMFISKGFFEDLSPEEQRFLIGHELIHVREQHGRYIPLMVYMAILLLLCIIWCGGKSVKKSAFLSDQQISLNIMLSVLAIIAFIAPKIAEYTYRKHIEWEADRESLKLLHSYDGGIKLIDRWINEFKMPLFNSVNLWADHPSNFERKNYCLAMKEQHEGNL